MRNIEAPHGRLLFPSIGAWAVLLVAGWATLPAGRLPQALSFGILALAAVTPWAVIRPAFARPDLIKPAAAAQSVQDASLTYDDSARLLGIALNETTVSPGGELAVRCCWEALGPMEEDYTVFVHLVGARDLRVAERHTYPGLGRFPTSLWSPGDAFCDTYRLRIASWAPVPELYDVAIGLFDADTGDRLPIRARDGSPVEYPALAQVRVVPKEPLQVLGAAQADFRLGSELSLVGYQVEGQIERSPVLTVTLVWRADADPQASYTAFVHLLDGEGEPLAQHDGIPRNGRYPTLAWKAGDVVPDEHVLQVDTVRPGEQVELVAGMYRAETLDRLPVKGPSGPVPDDLIVLELDAQ
jgi:hypothetical protein